MRSLKPKVTQAVPFFAVSNIEKSIRYYVDGLGFEMTNKWIPQEKIEWCWLQHGGASLMLQEIINDRRDMSGRKAGDGVSIYFICDDAQAIYQEIISKGIQATEPFVGNSMWVIGLTDPDGYKIYFESPTKVAEETSSQK